MPRSGIRRRSRAAAFAAATLLTAITALAVPSVIGAASSGVLDLCKVAGSGIEPGDEFDYEVTVSVVTRIVTVPADDCVSLAVLGGGPLSKGYYRSHPGDVTRLLPAAATLVVDGVHLDGSQVQAVLKPARTVIASSSLLLNLAQQLLAADLNVLRGDQPTATIAQAISDANAGIQVTIDGQGRILLATTLTQAQMKALVTTLSAFNEGKIKGSGPSASVRFDIMESIPADIELTSIVCAPAALCSGIDTTQGNVTTNVDLVGGETTTVTFTNRSTLGTLRLCKTAGSGILAGTSFTFKVQTLGDQAVAADGDCFETTLPETNTGNSDGNYWVDEYGCGSGCVGGDDDGFEVESIVCSGGGGCANTSLAVGHANVDLVGGETTTVTFTNRSTLGTLRLCKTAGSGITAGTSFTFKVQTLGDQAVAAGDCVEMTLPETNAGNSDGNYWVDEYGCGSGCIGTDGGFTVESIVCSGGGGCTASTSETLGHAVVDIVGGETTTVTFTNQMAPG